MFDEDGHFLESFGKEGDGRGEFRAPAGLAVDRNDNIYVTELGNNRVQVFTNKGQFLTTFGRKGSADGEFGNPHGIIVDRSSGRVYVADTANNRVQVFQTTAAKAVNRRQQ